MIYKLTKSSSNN